MYLSHLPLLFQPHLSPGCCSLGNLERGGEFQDKKEELLELVQVLGDIQPTVLKNNSACFYVTLLLKANLGVPRRIGKIND